MSHSLTDDPINSAIYDGINRGIKTCIENRCYGSAVILIYSGIDSMAYLSMPQNQTEVKRADFVQWCERYIRFPCKEQITGLELYSARCAMLHTYGVESGLTRHGHCRALSYMNRGTPEIRYSQSVDPNLVLVSIEALANALCDGINRFLVDLFSDPTQVATAEQRLKNLVVQLPAE